MVDTVPALTEPPEGYAEWLTDLKQRILASQPHVHEGLRRGVRSNPTYESSDAISSR